MKYSIQGDYDVFTIRDVPEFDGLEPLTPDDLVEALQERYRDVPGMSFESAPLKCPAPAGSDEAYIDVPRVILRLVDWVTPEGVSIRSLSTAVRSIAASRPVQETVESPEDTK